MLILLFWVIAMRAVPIAMSDWMHTLIMWLPSLF